MYRFPEIYSPDPGKGCQTTGKQAQRNRRKVRKEDNLTQSKELLNPSGESMVCGLIITLHVQFGEGQYTVHSFSLERFVCQKKKKHWDQSAFTTLQAYSKIMTKILSKAALQKRTNSSVQGTNIVSFQPCYTIIE